MLTSSTGQEHVLLPTRRCWDNHMGLWAIEAAWFGAAITAYREGLWPRALDVGLPWSPIQGSGPADLQALAPTGYDLTPGGIAIVSLTGPLSKAGSLKFQGTSSVQTRQALRQAARDADVQAIVLAIDSPGGHVAGIDALAQEISRTSQAKPVIAQIDDLGASAAYWVASQADAIYATTTSEVGSIGTLAVLVDTSGRMDRLGIKVHVVSTGEFKGLGVPGAPLSEAALQVVQDRVDAINSHFLQAVSQGRGLTPEQLAQVSDGRLHLATQARKLGLIDGVQDLEQTLEQLHSAPPTTGRRQRENAPRRSPLRGAPPLVPLGQESRPNEAGRPLPSAGPQRQRAIADRLAYIHTLIEDGTTHASA